MCTCIHACLLETCPSASHQSLSVQAVLGGRGVCSGGVIGQRAPAAGSGPAVQQALQFSGHAAGEGCIDPWVGARVQTGQQHQDSKGHPLDWRVGVPRCPKLDDEERRPADGVDQHDDQSHSHCLGHSFSDARGRGWGRMRWDIVE